jgi:hypothetical protein
MAWPAPAKPDDSLKLAGILVNKNPSDFGHMNHSKPNWFTVYSSIGMASKYPNWVQQ